MNKNIIFSTVLFAIILALSLVILIKDRNIGPDIDQSQNNGNEIKSEIIFFYGDSCPHCQIVEKFIDENKIKDKISFISKEVYNNKQNSNELVAKAKICGLPTDSIGVPFLWDGQKCLIGDQPIIDFFSAKGGSASGGKEKTNGK